MYTKEKTAGMDWKGENPPVRGCVDGNLVITRIKDEKGLKIWERVF